MHRTLLRKLKKQKPPAFVGAGPCTAEPAGRTRGSTPTKATLMDRVLFALMIFFCITANAANQNDLAKLPKIASEHNAIGLDLSNADLRNYQFVGSKINLQRANMSHADLTRVNLENVDLSNANLSYAKLENANLRGANLANANLAHANLSHANLNQANLTNTFFVCANLNDADLTKADFMRADISSATFINTITTDILHYNSVIDEKVNCN